MIDPQGPASINGNSGMPCFGANQRGQDSLFCRSGCRTLSGMPRRPRADEAGGLYHALNRGNARQTIFRKDADYAAFEKILSEGLELYDVSLFAFQLMPNHWHLVLGPNRDGAMSDFLRWVTATHTMRYHAHYQTSGQGDVYQGDSRVFQSRTMSTF